MSTPEAQEYWEQHYGARNRIWSGRVNARLAEVVEPLRPGRALDLGCGEGGDALWLADRGWRGACQTDPVLAKGLSTHDGALLSAQVATDLGVPFVEPASVLA